MKVLATSSTIVYYTALAMSSTTFQTSVVDSSCIQ